MHPYDEPAAVPPPPGMPATSRGRRWLIPGLLALAFVLTLGIGVFMGATMLRTAQAAANTPGGASFARFSLANTPGAHGAYGNRGPGQCDALTVASVNGSTITARAGDGPTVTIHTSSSTTYMKAGRSASASDVTVGSLIHVAGSKNSDGSINATRIDIR